jgi:hypothetical protein
MKLRVAALNIYSRGPCLPGMPLEAASYIRSAFRGGVRLAAIRASLRGSVARCWALRMPDFYSIAICFEEMREASMYLLAFGQLVGL